MTGPGGRDDLLLDRLLERESRRARGPRTSRTAAVSTVVTFSGIGTALYLGWVRSVLTEFYRQLGLGLDDVQLVPPYGGAPFWTVTLSVGVAAAIGAFAWLGGHVRWSRPSRWKAVTYRRTRREWTLAVLTCVVPLTALGVTAALGAPRLLQRIVASCVLAVWLGAVPVQHHPPPRRWRDRVEHLGTALALAVLPWFMAFLPRMMLGTGHALPPGLPSALFALMFLGYVYVCLLNYPGRLSQVLGFLLEAAAGVVLCVLLVVALGDRSSVVGPLAGAAGLAYTIGFAVGDRSLIAASLPRAVRAVLPVLVICAVLLTGVGVSVTQLDRASTAGFVLRSSGQLPRSAVLSENVHRAAVLPVGGDVLGICDASMTAVALSSGSAPFVLVRRDGSEPLVTILPDAYIVARVPVEQRGCTDVPSAPDSSRPAS